MKTNNQIRETGKHGKREPVLSAFLKKRRNSVVEKKMRKDKRKGEKRERKNKLEEQEDRPYGRYESVYSEPKQICVR